jgi:acyl carrier protein
MSTTTRVIEIERILVRNIEEMNVFEGPCDIDHVAHTPLVELGLDSLTVTHLRELIAEDFGCDVPATLLGFELDTIRKCAEYVAEHENERPKPSSSFQAAHGAF